jgi:hypothetical protein
MRWQAIVAAVITVLVVAVAAPGCLDENEDEDTLWDWRLGIALAEFDSNSQRVLNLTYFTFKVTFGPIKNLDWALMESHDFLKGNDSFFPIRIEAFYDDPGSTLEEFPIQGSSNTVTASLEFKEGKMVVNVDGASDTYTVSNKIDHLPHDKEKTITVSGTYGDLDIYISMREPQA